MIHYENLPKTKQASNNNISSTLVAFLATFLLAGVTMYSQPVS